MQKIPSLLETAAILERLSCQDVLALKDAERHIQTLETLPGMLVMLQNIVLAKEIPDTTRWMAAQRIRSIVEASWRKSSKVGITVEEKIQFRARVYLMLSESNKPILSQVALCLARIARWDYPSDWPSLFDDIFDLIKRYPESLERVLYVLHYIIKTFVGQKIGIGRRVVLSTTPFLAIAFVSIFNEHYENNENRSITASLYALKCLRYLLTNSILGLDSLVLNFMNRLSNYLTIFYSKGREKHLFTILKMVREVLDTHGQQWMCLEGAQSVVRWHLDVLGYKQQDVPERLIVFSMLFMKSVFRFAITSDSPKADRIICNQDGTIMNSQRGSFNSFVTPEILTQVIDLLITRYLTMSQEDILLAEENPYDFICEEEALTWEHKSRACGIHLLAEIGRNYTQITINEVIKILETFKLSGAFANGNENSVFALITAINTLADKLHERLSFTCLFQQYFMPFAQRSQSAWAKSTVCASISEFVGISVPRKDRPELYECIVGYFLQPKMSIVVRYAAVDTLRVCIDDWDFSSNHFEKFIVPSASMVASLLGDFTTPFEVKIKAINCLSVMAEWLTSSMLEFAITVANMLPQLWEHAGAGGEAESLFRASLLDLLRRLFPHLITYQSCFIETQSHPYFASAVQFVGLACDSNRENFVSLGKEGLQLWQTLTAHATSIAGAIELRHLLPLLYPLCEKLNENTVIVMKIIEGYYLLDSNYICNNGITISILERIAILLGPCILSSSSATSATSVTIDNQMRPEISRAIVNSLEVMLSTNPDSVVSGMIQSGVFGRLLSGIVSKTDHPQVRIGNIRLISRACLRISGDNFAQFCGDQLDKVIVEWMDQWDAILRTQHRKISILGLTKMAPYIFNHVPRLAKLWERMLDDVSEINGDAPVYWLEESEGVQQLQLSRDYNQSSKVRSEGQGIRIKPEDIRREELALKDPVHTISLRGCISEALENLAQILGGPAALKNHLGDEVTDQLRYLVFGERVE